MAHVGELPGEPEVVFAAAPRFEAASSFFLVGLEGFPLGCGRSVFGAGGWGAGNGVASAAVGC